MSAAITGINENENPWVSRSLSSGAHSRDPVAHGLRLPEPHKPLLASVEWIVEALHLKFDDALAFTPSLDFRHIGGAWKFTE
jgi:hypothetical protein